MPRAVWGTPQPASATGYESDEPRGLLGFFGGGSSDVGADISDRMGIIAQLLMNAGSGRGGAGIAEATAAANERSAARREDNRNKAMVNRMADKLEPSNPEMAMMMRANTKFGMAMLGKQLEDEWTSKSDMAKLNKEYELRGTNEQALEAQKQEAKDRHMRLVLEGAGLGSTVSRPPAPEAGGATQAPAGGITPAPIGDVATAPQDGVVPAPQGGEPPPAPTDTIPHEYYVGLPPGPAGQELLQQRLKNKDPEISLSEVTALKQALMTDNETGRQKYYDNIKARTDRQARVAGFDTRTNEVMRQNQALPGINLQQPGQPELMQAGINPKDPTVVPPNQVAQAGQYLRQATRTGEEEYNSALKDLMQPPSTGLSVDIDPDTGKVTGISTGKKGSGGKDTESNTKHTSFYIRGEASIPELLKPEAVAALTDYTLAGAAKVPLIGNALTKGPYQIADTAAENFLISVLRPDTGATIGVDEKAMYRSMFIPEPGDDAARVKYKAMLRGIALEGIRQGQSKEQIAATAKDAWRQLDPDAPGAKPPPLPDWAAKENVTPEAWAAHPELWFADDDEKPKP